MKEAIGKGKNLDTRPNPFRNAGNARKSYPSFTECADTLTMLDKGMEAGVGFIISGTRDGGAICLTVLDGDTRHRTYCANDKELQEAVDALIVHYEVP